MVNLFFSSPFVSIFLSLLRFALSAWWAHCLVCRTYAMHAHVSTGIEPVSDTSTGFSDETNTGNCI